MKIKGKDVMWKSENENVAVLFDLFDLGNKFKVYRKVSYMPEDIKSWAYAYAFGTMGEAMSCAREIPDIIAVR